jgi:hypothetical protein
MRPRTEPEPEPGELFRPSSDQANPEGDPKTTAVPQTSSRPADQNAPKQDRTALVPTVQPPVPGNAGVPADATTKVSPPPGSGSGQEAAALASPVGSGGRSDQKDGGRDRSEKGDRPEGNGQAGAERADRSASASRSG